MPTDMQIHIPNYMPIYIPGSAAGLSLSVEVEFCGFTTTTIVFLGS
jgi:hypothetical protein